MKKILFASTALIATAGMAAADINFSGGARFGIGYLEDRETNVTGAGAGVSDTILIHRFTLNIDGSAETDGGVEFGARVRLRADESQATGEAGAVGDVNAPRFSVKYGGLEVYAGNTGGALDNMDNAGFEPGLEFFVGQEAARDYSEFGYSSGGAGSNALYATYAAGDLLVGIGYNDGSQEGGTTDSEADIFISYNFGDFGAVLGYSDRSGITSATDADTVMLALSGSFGDFSGTLLVGDEDLSGAAGEGNFYGASAQYAVSSATAIQFAYGDGEADADTRAYGIGASHDLGGGVTLRGGIGNIKEGAASSYNRADFGVSFGF